MTSKVTRRGLLVGGAGVAAGAGALAATGLRGNDGGDDGGTHAGAGSDVVPFYGTHQAGIVTPAQDRLYFGAFDVITDDLDQLVAMLREWTVAAEQMSRGVAAGEFGATDGPYLKPPEDTGEALDLPASSLTITVGFGRSLFVDAEGTDRFGLAGRLPDSLIDLPHFPGDNLDPALTGGDLCVQACGDDPQVVFHAVRNLARIGFGTVSLRWSQLGFGRTSSTSRDQRTPRNLFGFKDGTANLVVEETDELDRHLWVHHDDLTEATEWMANGTYLVARRISMHIETWDRTSLQEQEQVIGRTKATGAPLSGGEEFTDPDFDSTGRDDVPLVGLTSHVRLAHPDFNNGVRLLRRGYNFTDGSNGLGRLDAGLFFIAFVRDPVTQFVPMQTTLARDDALSEYLVHTGSALFAVPPGTAEGSMFGAALFS